MRGGGDGPGATTDVFRFSLDTNEWEAVFPIGEPPPFALISHTAEAVKGHIFFFFPGPTLLVGFQIFDEQPIRSGLTPRLEIHMVTFLKCG